MSKNIISSGLVHKVPDDLRKLLLADMRAHELWEELTPIARNEWICWITFVKQEKTRQQHLERTISELKEGIKRPCCWIGCIHRKDKKISPSVQHILQSKRRN